MQFLDQSGTPDTATAASLLAMGFELRKEQSWNQVIEGREAVTFFFEEVSQCGEFSLPDMLAAWDDAAWHRENPRHPLAYLRVYVRNRQRYRDMRCNGVRLAAAWREGKMHLLSVVSRDFQARTEPLPVKPDGTGIAETADECLSAALCAVGVPLETRAPWRKGGNGEAIFRHHAISPDGQMNARELALGWISSDWWARNREHPFAYVYCAEQWSQRLTRAIKARAPMVMMEKGGMIGMLSADASARDETTFMKEWKKY